MTGVTAPRPRAVDDAGGRMHTVLRRPRRCAGVLLAGVAVAGGLAAVGRGDPDPVVRVAAVGDAPLRSSDARSTGKERKNMRWLLRFATLLMAVLLPVNSVAASGSPPLCQSGCATAIALPLHAAPFGITRGPLGSVWFSLDNAVGRIDQKGVITTYPAPTANADVGWLTADPRGAVWFAERGGDNIGRIDPNGKIREYALPFSPAVPQGIVRGPDGNLYITEQGANAITRLNPSTGVARDFPVPTPESTPLGLALGSDGALWFIERTAAKVGRMTLNGTFTEYPLAKGAFPNRIVAAPDGALWFTELKAGKIGRITTAGVLTEFPIVGGPVGITIGKDGQLYVDLYVAHAVDRVNLKGAVTGHWDLPGAVGPLQITPGFGLDIWVTDNEGGKLYRLTPYAVGRPAA